jgi:hypothetical protein
MFASEILRRTWEFRLKRVIWVVGFFAALSLKAGSFLGKGDIVRPSRVGEQPSSATDNGLEEQLVPPSQRPGSDLSSQVDPNFKGNRSPGARPPYRFQFTSIKNQLLLLEVDPNGPYKHLQDKVGHEVSGSELGIPQD